MTNLIVEISKYLMILLMAVYTYANFRFFSFPDMERKRRQIANGKSSLYEEYRNGHISRERFIKIQSDNKAEDERLQQKIAEKNVLLNECIQKQKALTLAGQDAERIQALTEYRPEVISRLIDKVRVFEGGRIEIGLKSKYLTDIIGECIPGLAS